MTTPRRTPTRRARPVPPSPAGRRQQGAWGMVHHKKPHQFDAHGNRVAGRSLGQVAASLWSTKQVTYQRASTRARKLHRVAVRPVRRPRSRRGTLFALFSVGIGVLCLTAVTLELTGAMVASGLFAAAEGVAGVTAWWIGEPPAVVTTASRRTGKGGYTRGGLCGAPCSDKTPCQNPIATGQSHCHLHGGNGPKTKPTTRKRTTRKAPPAGAATPTVTP